MVGYSSIEKALTSFVITNAKIVNRQDFEITARRLITALRLLKSDTISHSYLIHIGNGTSLIGCGASDIKNLLSSDGIFSRGNYTLSKKDLPRLRKNYKLLAKFENESSFEVVLRRYNFACSRTNSEDKIIDYTTALESLLLKDQNELSNQFSLRAAFLLRKRNGFKNTYDTMKNLYNARSKIVHMGVSFSEKEHKFKLKEVENLVNLIIVSAIKMVSKPDTQTLNKFY
ncbi:MAG: hypothetical protein KGQ36_06320 [Rickettsiales bacterium]|nr:hypothetical protein [Rickettsiales bacterium]